MQIPHSLYQRIGDFEHDDCVLLATFVARATGEMRLDMVPLVGFDWIAEAAMELVHKLSYWLSEEGFVSWGDNFVDVCVPLPIELFGVQWSHWLSVEIGRYACKCILTTLSQLETFCEVDRGTFEDSLLAESQGSDDD